MLVFREEQALLKKSVQEFVADAVKPYAAAWDEESHCPVELFPMMGELGLAGIIIPEKYGGEGLGFFERAIILEELARHSAGLAISLMTHQLGITPIMVAGTEEQKQTYLPELASGKRIASLSTTEPGGGSDFNGQKAHGELVNGQWVINGHKCFITNSHITDVDVWIVRTGEDEKGRSLLSAFIIEKGMPGYGPGRKENKVGLRSSVTGDVICKDTILNPKQMIGLEGQGGKIGMQALGEVGRSGMAAIGLGILRGCLEESVKFAKERIIYGKPLSKLQSAQFIIGENRTAYEAARLLLYNAVSRKDAGQPCIAQVAMAKYFISEAAVEAAKRTMDLMGAYGCINEYPVSRYLRDAMTCLAAGGTNHIHKIIISGAALNE